MEQDLLAQLKSALAGHDWYYGYSDDYSVYRRGQEQANRINDLRRQCVAAGLGDEALAIYAAASSKVRRTCVIIRLQHTRSRR